MYVPQPTADGSFTFFCALVGEAFHSHYGARQEAHLKFVEPTHLSQKAQQPTLRLLDVCYGLGYNTAAALATIWAVNPSCYVDVVALEFNPAVPQAAIAHHLLDTWPQPIPQILTQLAIEHQVQTDPPGIEDSSSWGASSAVGLQPKPPTPQQIPRPLRVRQSPAEGNPPSGLDSPHPTHRLNARLLIGDARDTIRLVQSSFQADAIFLDPFSPPKCPQLWTVEFLEQVAKCLYLNGRLATYSCAAAVRTALMATGLRIGSTPPVGRRSPGTVASWVATDLPVLSRQEQEHLLTRAAIPYRDPCLNESADVILHRRQQEQQTSSLEPTSHWRKRTSS